MLLTAVSWDGGPTGNGTDFLTAANWVGDALPGAADTAVLDPTGTNPTITISGTPLVQAITSSRNLQMTGGTISGTLAFSGGANLLTSGSSGTLSNLAVTGGDILLNTTSSTVLVSGTTSFPAVRMTANVTTLQIAAGYTLNDLVVAEGATAGTRNITLAVGGAGTITVGATGIIRLAAGCGGGVAINNSSAATLVNNGLISAEAAGRTMAFNNTTVTNNTTLQVTAGTLDLTPTNWSNPGSMSAASGTTATFGGSWSNAGTLTVNTATLNLGGTFSTSGFNFPGFTRTAGTVNLTGTLNNAASTLTLDAATGTWNMLGGTINNGSLVMSGGSSLAMTASGGTLASVAVSGGDLLLNATSVSVLVSGTTSFPAVRMTGNAVTLQMGPGYVLNDLVVAEGATAGGRSITMAVGGAGTITVGATGIIRLAAGCGGGLSLGNSSAATLVNNGLISAEAAGRTMAFNNTTVTNNTTLQVTAGTLDLTPTNWSNPGTITAASGTTATFGGNWSNAGTLTVTSATLNLGGTFSTSGFNFPGFTRTAGTVNLTGTLNNAASTLTLNAATGTWNFVGGTINNGSLVMSGGSILALTSSGGTLASVAVSGGDLLLNATSVLVLVSGTTSFPAARLTANAVTLQMSPGYTLNDLVVAEGATAGTRNITLAVGGAGTITVGATGIIRLAAGCGGGVAINNSSAATLVNNGLISAEAASRTMAFNNSTVTNNTTLQVTAGTLDLTPTNWSNPGTITAASGTTATFGGNWSNAGTLTVNTATLNLGGTFSTSGFNFPGFTRTAGTVNLTGTLNNAASTLTLDAATGTWNFVGGTINNGSLVMSGGSILALTSSGGTLASVAVSGGDLLLNATSVNVLVSGTTSFPAARLTANAVTLQMAPGYTLNNLVVAEGATAGTRNITLAVGGAGTITVGATGIIRLAAGCGGGLSFNNSSTATLVNNGLISAEAASRTMAFNNTTVTNNTTLQVTAGTLDLTPTNWTNPGSITAASGTTVTFGGSWSNAGTLTVNTATLNLGGTFSTTGFNFVGFTRTAGTVNLTGTVNNTAATLTLNASTGTWNFVGGTINNGSLVMSGGSILALTPSNGTLASVAVSGGDLQLATISAVVLVSGTTTFPAARLTANGATLQTAPGYTLNNLVVAEGATAGTRNIAMAVGGSGTMTVSATGIIRVASGSGGGIAINNSSSASLINNGLISSEAAGRTINFNNTSQTNNGTLQTLNGGSMSINNLLPSNLNGSSANGLGGVMDITGTYTINQPFAITGSALVYFRPTWTKSADIDMSGKAIFDYTGASPFASLSADVISGYNGGAWNGPGINSTAAAANLALGVGYARSTDIFSSFNAIWNGQSVDATSVLMRLTLNGDANIDGTVDTVDFNLLAANFSGTGKLWLQGDFNYDGVVDTIDFNQLAANFSLTVAAPSPGASAGPAPSMESLFADLQIDSSVDLLG